MKFLHEAGLLALIAKMSIMEDHKWWYKNIFARKEHDIIYLIQESIVFPELSMKAHEQ